MNKYSFFLIASICGLIIFCRCGSGLYIPALPQVAHEFGSNASTIKFTSTFYTIGAFLSLTVFGVLSDAFGRRAVVLSGLSIAAVGLLICFSATSISILLLGRVTEGIGAGACAITFRAMLRDIAKGSELARLGSMLSILNTSTLMLTPLLGGLLVDHLGWRAVFAVILLVCFSNMFFVAIMPESYQEKSSMKIEYTSILTEVMKIIRDKKFLQFSIIAALIQSQSYTWMIASSLILQEGAYSMSASQFGTFDAALGCAFMCGAICNAKLVKKFNCLRLFSFGILVSMLSSTSMAIISHYVVSPKTSILIIFMSCIYFSHGFVFPNAFAIASEKIHKAFGLAVSLFMSLQYLGIFIGSTISAFLGSHFSYLSICLLIEASSALLIFHFSKDGATKGQYRIQC